MRFFCERSHRIVSSRGMCAASVGAVVAHDAEIAIAYQRAERIAALISVAATTTEIALVGLIFLVGVLAHLADEAAAFGYQVGHQRKIALELLVD
jgi:hypothetical protein